MSFIQKIKSRIDWYLLGGKQRHEEFVLQRKRNQQHCYDFPSENHGWRKNVDGPVYGNKETGTIFDPYVLYANRHFLMVASERKTGSLILLSSKGGQDWKKQSSLLLPKPKTWEQIVNRGCMLHVEGVWHLWYTGQQDGVGRIGHLTSEDMSSFMRTDQQQPVMEASLPHEGVSVMNPCVLWDEDAQLFRMWYAAGENYEPDVICYAESADGDHWTKHSQPVLTKYGSHEWEKYKVGGCDVKKHKDGSYIIYYIGYQNLDVARICFATSKDGIHWERPDNNIAIAPSKGAWDGDATYKPSFLEHNGRQYLWYNGRSGVHEYIGLATKENEHICL